MSDDTIYCHIKEADTVQQIIVCKMHSDISEKCCENLSILTALLLLDIILYFLFKSQPSPNCLQTACIPSFCLQRQTPVRAGYILTERAKFSLKQRRDCSQDVLSSGRAILDWCSCVCSKL